MRRSPPVDPAVLAPLLLLLPAAAPGVAAQSVVGRAAAIELGGRVQTQFRASTVASGEAEFFFRRARLNAAVELSDRLDGRLQVDVTGGSASLEDAWLRIELVDDLRLSVGQFKRAFDLFALSSSTELSVIERDGRIQGVRGCPGVGGVCSYGRLVDELGFVGRDQGLRLDADLGGVEWLLTLTNGTGKNRGDENDAKSVSGRVVVPVGRGWAIGGQAAAHDYEEDDATRYATAWALDAEYGDFRDGLHLQAGFATGDNQELLDADGVEPTWTAAQVIASVFFERDGTLVSGWEPLLRGSWADADRGVRDDAGVVLTPGAMLYLGGRTKVGFNVDVWWPESGDSEASLKLQSFLYF